MLEIYVKDLLSIILEYNADIAVCLFEKGNSDRFNDIIEENHQNIIVLNNIEAFNKLYDDILNVNMVVAWNKLYSKNLFNKIRFPVGKIHEDEFTTTELLFEAKKIVIINKKDYYYFQSPNSIMRSEFKINRLDALEAFEERINLFNQEGLNELANKTLSAYIYILIRYICIIDNLNDKNYQKAKNTLIKKFKRY